MNAHATHVRHCLPPSVAACPVVRVPVSQMTRPNGVTTTWSYEQYRDLVTQVQNGTVSTYGYVNDAIGRRTSMSRSGSAYATSDVISYTYNDRSELTGAVSNVDTTYSYSYVYDPIGNRVTASEAGVSWTYTTNSLNQYTSATENNVQLNFAYDLDGSMTYRPVDATSGWTQVWNGENRMVETFKGTDRLTFRYDYMGRRVEKCVYSDNVLASRTLFIYDGFKCVEELDALDNNAVLMRHSWQPSDIGLDIILATTDVNATSYFLHDANKNVMQKTYSDGLLVNSCQYTPFGIQNSLDRENIAFSSEFSEREMALYYYNYRYYFPTFSRWLSRDPINEIDFRLIVSYAEKLDNFTMNNNYYIFVNNNPVSAYDFLGLHGVPGSGISPHWPKKPSKAFDESLKKLKEVMKNYLKYLECKNKNKERIKRRLCPIPCSMPEPLDELSCQTICEELYEKIHSGPFINCIDNLRDFKPPLPIP